MTRILWAFFLLVIIAAIGLLWAHDAEAQHHGLSVAVEAKTDSLPPTETGWPWRNPNDGRVYFYSPADTLWLDAGTDLVASKTAADVTGALRWGVGTAHDTTSTSADGLWLADSTVVTEIHFYGEQNGGTNASTRARIYTNRIGGGPVLKLSFDLDVATGISAHDSTNMRLFLPDSVRVGMFIWAPDSAPDNPKVLLRVHKFVRP